MQEGIEVSAPTNKKVSRALAFFLRAVGSGVFIWLTLTALAALRWE